MNIYVSSPSFSNNKVLRNRLLSIFPNTIFNDQGNRNRNFFLKNAKNAQGMIIGLEKINSSALQELPHLRFIAKYGVGLDNIDFCSLKKFNILFHYSPGVNAEYVAEQALGAMIGIRRKIVNHIHDIKKGKWIKDGGTSIFNKKIGIIGLGNTGKALCKLLKPFNCNLKVCDIKPDGDFIKMNNLHLTSKEEIFKSCSIISLHIPLTEQTYHYVSNQELELLEDNTLILNTSRGEVVNLDALEKKLEDKNILYYADVFSKEPYEDIDFLQNPAIFPTPHTAGNSKEAVEAMGHAAIDSLVTLSKKGNQ